LSENENFDDFKSTSEVKECLKFKSFQILALTMPKSGFWHGLLFSEAILCLKKCWVLSPWP